jgi:hypothetical protein
MMIAHCPEQTANKTDAKEMGKLSAHTPWI